MKALLETDESPAAVLYRSCMAPIKPQDADTVLGPWIDLVDTVVDNSTFVEAVIAINNADLSFLWTWYVDTDAWNKQRHAFTISQSHTSLDADLVRAINDDPTDTDAVADLDAQVCAFATARSGLETPYIMLLLSHQDNTQLLLHYVRPRRITSQLSCVLTTLACLCVRACVRAGGRAVPGLRAEDAGVDAVPAGGRGRCGRHGRPGTPAPLALPCGRRPLLRAWDPTVSHLAVFSLLNQLCFGPLFRGVIVRGCRWWTWRCSSCPVRTTPTTTGAAAAPRLA